MSLPRMRPRLALLVPLGTEEVRGHLQEAVKSPTAPVRAMLSRHEVELMVEEDQQRLWTPQLALRLTEVEAGQTLITGRFGPQPHLWALIVAMFALAVFTIVGGLVLGWSQWLLGDNPSGLLMLPFGIVLGGLAHGSGFLGQRLSEPQMTLLWDFLERAMAVHVIELHRPEQDRLSELLRRDGDPEGAAPDAGAQGSPSSSVQDSPGSSPVGT